MSTSAISTASLREAISIKEQIEELEARLSRVLGGGNPGRGRPPKSSAVSTRRVVSPATIAKMRMAQQARWAKKKGKATTTKSNAKPAAKSKGGMSPEVRAKIAAAAKARWASRKGVTSTATSASNAKPGKAAKPAKAIGKKGALTPAGRAKLAAAMKARWAARKAAAPAADGASKEA